MPESSKLNALQLEKLINSVDGVVSCKVVTLENGDVAEVHILAGEQRNPKQLARDVETTCLVQLGLELDHKKISIAHVRETPEGGMQTAPIPLGKRILLRGVSSALAENQVEVTVELGFGNRVEVGRASGRKTQSNQQRLLAKAALHALTSLLDDRDLFVLEQVAVQPFAQQSVALVSVTLAGQDQEEMLLGAAFVRSDQREAIVRATLDAVNRRSGQLMSLL